MAWTQKEMEELYAKMQKKSMTDAAFRKELLENSTEALAKLAGKELPEGCKIKIIENDPAYTATFVIPDLISEEFTAEQLDAAAGGEDNPGVNISVLAIISACAAALGGAACPADACGALACSADEFCAAKACGADAEVG